MREIKGKNANHGKIGFGKIQDILVSLDLPTLIPSKDLKIMISNNSQILWETFHSMYCLYANDNVIFDIKTFTDSCKKLGGPWIFSKFNSIHLAHIIVKYERGNEFVTKCIRYAASLSELSAPFVKLE